MNDRRVGIILKQQDYRENDALLTVYVHEYGKMTFVAKGIRKMQSKNAAACLPFTEAELLYDHKEGSSIQTLHQASIKKSHRKIREDFKKNCYASAVCEIIEKILDENEFDELSEQCLKMTLDGLDEENHDNLYLSFFTAQMLKVIGIEPQVDECVLCGNLKVNGIAMEEGGFVCEDCGREVKLTKLPVPILRQFRLLNRALIEHIEILKRYEPYQDEIVSFMIDFLCYHSGIRLNSWQLYNKTL